MKTILITGASRGIGAALALCYAKAGNRLVLIARNENKLAQIAEQCRSRSAEVIVESLDIRQIEALQAFIQTCDQRYPFDLVICNAGVTSAIGSSGEAEEWAAICRVVDTNLYGVLATLNPLISAMQSRQRGQIALISSLAAYRGMPITPVYCATKAAVKSYGEALRGWLKPDGIRVSVVCPGFVESDMSQTFPGDKMQVISADQAARLIQRGLEKNRPVISFPFPLNLGMWALSILPASIGDWLMQRLSYGSRRA